MKILEVKNLTVTYGRNVAVKNLSFEVQKGEIVTLVGESGSGKSTVLSAIAQLLPPYAGVEGEIKLNGINISKLPKRELNRIRGKLIGFIFQEPSAYLDPLFKVGKQIEETCLIHSSKNCYEKTLNSLRGAGINEPIRIYNAYPHQLSGGLKQRVNIADATVNEPMLLLADEPTTALDVTTQKRVLNLFRKIREEGKAILLVTHDFGVVWEVADRVIVMKNGEKVEEGTVYEIYENPQHPYTHKLIEIFKTLASF
jgi:peptide/nickel transport system ATP-binding protein